MGLVSEATWASSALARALYNLCFQRHQPLKLFMG
jgi:hypothetical protein